MKLNNHVEKWPEIALKYDLVTGNTHAWTILPSGKPCRFIVLPWDSIRSAHEYFSKEIENET